MSGKPAAILCASCAAPAGPGTAACPICNGRLVKVCGSCNFQNSAAKNYCDLCGEPLQTAAPAAPLPPPRPGAELPNTAVFRPGPAGPAAEPQSREIRRRSAHSERFRNLTPARPAGRPAAPPPKAGAPSAETAVRRERRAEAASLALGLLLLAGGLAVWAYRRYDDSRPENVLLKAARRYLGAMQARDYEAAYGLLSSASRENCPLEEFKLLQATAPWSFSDSDVVIVKNDVDAALVSYRLATQERKPETDYLFFQNEGGRWTRPWTRNLFNKIEDAFDRGNADLAYSLAKAAVSVNPRDPIAQGYLCEGAYYGKLAEEAVRECRAAIALAEKYPSDLTPESRYHLHAVLGDVLKNTLNRYPEALEEWTALLRQFPYLSPQDQCEALLARGETRVLVEDYSGALQDYRSAAGVCSGAEDQRYLTRQTHVLSGDDAAKAEAVGLVQNYRMAGAQETLREWGESLYADLKRRMHYGTAGGTDRAEWSADYVGGTRYKVKLEAAHSVIVTADADLWTNAVHAAVAPPPERR